MQTTTIVVEQSPWHALWRGGRLMDIYHAESDHALDCVQVGPYDWQKGKLESEPSETDLRERLQEWINEQGATFTRELPYLD